MVACGRHVRAVWTPKLEGGGDGERGSGGPAVEKRAVGEPTLRKHLVGVQGFAQDICPIRLEACTVNEHRRAARVQPTAQSKAGYGADRVVAASTTVPSMVKREAYAYTPPPTPALLALMCTEPLRVITPATLLAVDDETYNPPPLLALLPRTVFGPVSVSVAVVCTATPPPYSRAVFSVICECVSVSDAP
jgi:hypothetical protein